ncbi:MAG: hypothetical protein QGG23_04195 [Candidatus Bathyarchaeota archaeon]|nr:hypothetical protein [Candidatus Bathyarchaeota archaeon]MDP7442825.1 hypothetical protein [Candidatus Bathyarchaeota archaeon]
MLPKVLGVYAFPWKGRNTLSLLQVAFNAHRETKAEVTRALS